ncbi:MAG TPA: flippase [Allosphingosinicella sp.]|nr:flippase [Allosphingosinicella sp.]
MSSIPIRDRLARLFHYARGEGLGPFMIRAVTGSGVLQIGGMAVSFLVGVQLARGLGLAGYGLYGLAIAVVTLASVPGEFGLPKLVMREVAAAAVRKDFPSLLGVIGWANRVSLGLSVLAAVFIACAAVLFRHRLEPGLVVALLWGIPVIPLVAVGKIEGAALQGLHNVVLGQAGIYFLRPLFFSACLALLFWLAPKAGPGGAMALNAITAALALILTAYWLKSRLPKPGRRTSVVQGRAWLSATVPMALTDGMRILQAQLGVVMMGVLNSPSEVGLFRIAASTATMIAIPIALITSVTNALLASLHAEGDTVRLQKLNTHSAWAMTIGVLALALPLFLAGRFLLIFFFGGEYGPAATALDILCFGQLISAAFGLNSTLLDMTGHERRTTRAMIIGLVVNVVALAALAPRWGNVGAAWATTLSLLVWNVLTWVDAWKLVGIDTSVLPRPAGGADRGRRTDPFGPGAVE